MLYRHDNGGRRITMKKITVLLLFLLLSVAAYALAAHAEEPPMNAPASEMRLEEVERHLARSSLTQGDAQTMIRAMTDARFTVQQMMRASEQLVLDETGGLTVQAVKDKIFEGIAKGVPPEAIVTAAAKVKSRHEYASQLASKLNETNTTQVAIAYADCLAAGLSEQHAHQLTNALYARVGTPGTAGSRNLAMETLLTAREMVRRRISSATTFEVLESALNNGFSEQEMHTLRQSLAAGSGDPEDNAKRFGNAIEQGVRAGDLQGLGNSRGSGGNADMGGGTGAAGSGDSGSGGGGNGGGSGGGGSGGGRR
jgi:hypothetical protein